MGFLQMGMDFGETVLDFFDLNQRGLSSELAQQIQAFLNCVYAFLVLNSGGLEGLIFFASSHSSLL